MNYYFISSVYSVKESRLQILVLEFLHVCHIEISGEVGPRIGHEGLEGE